MLKGHSMFKKLLFTLLDYIINHILRTIWIFHRHHNISGPINRQTGIVADANGMFMFLVITIILTKNNKINNLGLTRAPDGDSL